MARLTFDPPNTVRLVSLEDHPEIFEGWVEAFNKNPEPYLVRAQTPRSPTIRYRIHPTLVQVKPGQRVSFQIQIKIKPDDYLEPSESELRMRLSFVPLDISDHLLSTELLWDGIPASERNNITLSLILTRPDPNLNVHENAIRTLANDCDPVDYLDEFPVDLDDKEDDPGVIVDQCEQDLDIFERDLVSLDDHSGHRPVSSKRQDIRDQLMSLSQSLEKAKSVRANDRKKRASDHLTDPVWVPKTKPGEELPNDPSDGSSVLEARIVTLEMDFKNLQSEMRCLMQNLKPQINGENAAALVGKETRSWLAIISSHWGWICLGLFMLAVVMTMSRFGPPTIFWG